MIRLYKIKIGEKVYEVEVEKVTEKEGRIEAEKKEYEKTENQVKEKILNHEGIKVEAPMQGLVLNILVKEGDKIKAGQDLIILEAMKMENPIVSPVDGVLSSINVSKGDTVESGDTLVTIV